MGVSENVPCGSDEEDRDYHAHGHGKASVDSRRGFDALDVQPSENDPEEDRPRPIGHARSEHVRLLADPNDANHGIEHVIHHHAPTCHVTSRRIDFLADVGKR